MSLYERFWFATQRWWNARARRPYTFWFRDIWHKYPLAVITIGGIAIYLLGRYTTQISILVIVGVVVGILLGELLGHLFWGKSYKPNQQEHPTYLGED